MSKEDSKEEGCTMCTKLGLRPISRDNLLFYYGPAVGSLSYLTLSVNVMNPALIARALPSKDATNILLMNSIVGCSFYLYNRPHLRTAPMGSRVLYCGYGSVMFNLGSVLMWAVIRSMIHKGNCVATIIGILSGVGLTLTGRAYLAQIDEGNKEKV